MKTLSAYSYRRNTRQIKQKRLVKLIIFCVVLLGLTSMIFPDNNIARGSARFPQTIIVEQGDTLWALAKRYLPDRMDIRAYVHQIKKHNQINGSMVYPGQLLELP